jgi:hypothetical protein
MVARQEHMAEVTAHVGWWARHPDAGSNFARLVGRVPDMPDAEVFAMLHRQGYDGLLYLDDGKIIGHCFFQRHDGELHAFSTWISEQYRGKLMATLACFDFVAYASACEGIVRARFGTGNPGDQLLEPLTRLGDELGWRVRKGAWVGFATERTGAAR